jgi:cell division protein FtsB
MTAHDHKAVSGVVDIRSIHAEYVAGSIAAAWCKSDFQVRAARCREAAALIRAQAAELEKLRQRCEELEARVRLWRQVASFGVIDSCNFKDVQAAIDRAGGGEPLVEIVGGEE